MKFSYADRAATQPSIIFSASSAPLRENIHWQIKEAGLPASCHNLLRAFCECLSFSPVEGVQLLGPKITAFPLWT